MAAAIQTQSTTLEGQALEIISALQAKENDQVSNPQGENRITSSINQDAGQLTFNGDIPVVQNLVNGLPTFEAGEYLN